MDKCDVVCAWGTFAAVDIGSSEGFWISSGSTLLSKFAIQVFLWYFGKI